MIKCNVTTQSIYQSLIKIENALKKMLKGSVPTIRTEMLANSMRNESDWVILDSREFIEFEVSHLPNAIWLGYTTFSFDQVSDIPKDAKLGVYCSIGVRSEKIAEKLLASGFSNVWNLYGGIFAWANERKALVEQNQQPTLCVHGYDKNWAKLLDDHVHCILNKS